MGTHPIFESDFDCLTWERTVRLKNIMPDTEAPAAPAPVVAAAPGSFTVETAVQDVLKHGSHRDALSRGLNEAVRVLERRDALSAFWRKTATRPTTFVSSRLCALNTRSQLYRSVTTKPWASGPDFAKLTAREMRARSSDAHVLLFAPSKSAPLGTIFKLKLKVIKILFI